ncbi:MAG: hypothetical protein JF606_29430, partial [Burkholderiales bacterium]|nr:hypothetical protein [Burkholderiales bacterium]
MLAQLIAGLGFGPAEDKTQRREDAKRGHARPIDAPRRADGADKKRSPQDACESDRSSIKRPSAPRPDPREAKREPPNPEPSKPLTEAERRRMAMRPPSF